MCVGCVHVCSVICGAVWCGICVCICAILHGIDLFTPSLSVM